MPSSPARSSIRSAWSGVRSAFMRTVRERRIELGLLPIARRDLERLQQMFSIIPRLMDLQAPMRGQRGLLHRSSLPEALTWIDIHADRADVVGHWRQLLAQRAEHQGTPTEVTVGPYIRRRRRRRRVPRGIQ